MCQSLKSDINSAGGTGQQNIFSAAQTVAESKSAAGAYTSKTSGWHRRPDSLKQGSAQRASERVMKVACSKSVFSMTSNPTKVESKR